MLRLAVSMPVAFCVSALLVLASNVGSANEAQHQLATPDPVPNTRPNIVFMLADDLGFTDIAPYGSEVSTPNLSRLAQQGIRFTNYHTAANCAPARAMLLTGVDNHLAGVPNIPEMLAPEQRVHAHYQGVLGSNVVTVATLLEDAGYHTYMAGKWHLGMEPHKLPSSRGFQRTLALADSGADNWEQRPYLPIYDRANWFADGQPYQLPDDFYSSRFIIDKTIEFIDSNLQDGQPFFAYVPFQAVHIPVQAPQKFIDRYRGRYDSGWETLRRERRDRAIEVGVVPPETSMVHMASTRDWAALSEDRKRYESKRMAVYAAMIEAMDFHIGRLMDFLESRGEIDNTIFIFTSDNGAEASGPHDPQAFPVNRMPASLGYNLDYETLGLKGSYNTISPSFASAAASPFAFNKFYVGEGGIRVPLVIAGARLLAVPEFSHAFAWATDITPTILAFAGVEHPRQRYAGRAVLPIIGRDLSPIIAGNADRVYTAEDTIGYELTGHGVLFQGDYKLVLNRPPLGDGEWHLYNIVTDPGEVSDLRGELTVRFQQMLSAYERFERDNAVLPIPRGYSHTAQLAANALAQRFGTDILIAMLTLLVVLPFVLVGRRKYLDRP